MKNLFCFIFLIALGSTPSFAAGDGHETSGIFALRGGSPRIESRLVSTRAHGTAQLDIAQYRGTQLLTGYTAEQTKLMHLILVSDDFTAFLHLHPVLSAGHFRISTALRSGQAYYLFADTTPAGLPQQVFRFTIGGMPRSVEAAHPASDTVSDAGLYHVVLSSARVVSNKPLNVTATISKGGRTVKDLSPYLGSIAHAVFVNTKTLDYVHVHPMANGESMAPGMQMGPQENLASGSRLSGKMNLALPPLAAGTYRMWLQFATPDGVRVAPFTITVESRSLPLVLLDAIGRALYLAAGMFWQVGWSLVLGFLLSGLVQAVVTKEGMRERLGRNGVRQVALATFYGAVSSSCSYAAAAMSKTLFKKGAGLIPSLAFLFSSTNLVIELGLILILLMGWQFAAAEWVGGLVLITIMGIFVKLTYPARLIAQARAHLEGASGQEHGDNVADGATLFERLKNPQTKVLAAQNAAMDWSMLWQDLVIGFLIAGALAALVPDSLWKLLFLSGAPAWLAVPLNAIIGTLIAVLTFVCSIGNVPMAAILWGSGLSFAGVLSFLYADLIVLPLLDIYRKYYGWKMAAYIASIFFITMTLTGIIMNAAFTALHLIPVRSVSVLTTQNLFSINYTFWLNLFFGGLALYVWYLNRKNPKEHGCHSEHEAPAL